VKVVIERAGGALEAELVDRALAAGHDVRVLDGPAAGQPLPRGCRLADAPDGDVVVAVVGGLAGAGAEALAALDDLARCAAIDGATLVVVAFSDLEAVEALLAAHGGGWTLQAATVLHDDLATALAEGGPPAEVAVQPVDAGEVAERVVRLLRVGPAGRVPDFAGPQVLELGGAAASGGPGWPGAWTNPDRAVGRRTWEEWLAHRSAGPLDGGAKPGRAEALGGRPGLVQQG
jgi:hypothetical protein